MPLPTDTWTRCNEILLRCREFRDWDSLYALLAVKELVTFRDRLQRGRDLDDRVEKVISDLQDARLPDDTFVFPLFLRRLRDKYKGQSLYRELDDLAHLVQALDQPPPSTTPQALIGARELPKSEQLDTSTPPSRERGPLVDKAPPATWLPEHLAALLEELSRVPVPLVPGLASFVHANRDALVTSAIADHFWRTWGGGDESAPREFAALLRRLASYRLRLDRIAPFTPRWKELDPAEIFEQAFSAASRRALIELHPDTHERLAPQLSGDELFPMMIDGLFYELGIHTGEGEPRSTGDVDRDHVRFRINDFRTAAQPTLHADECLVNDTVDRLKLLNIAGREAENPANGSECAIVPIALKEICEQAGLTTWTEERIPSSRRAVVSGIVAGHEHPADCSHQSCPSVAAPLVEGPLQFFMRPSRAGLTATRPLAD